MLANSYTFQTYSIPYTYVQQYHMISRALCQPSHQLQARTHSTTTRLFDAFWQPSHPMQASLFRLGARRALLKPGRVSWLEVNQPVVRLDSPILWYHPLKGLVKCISMLLYAFVIFSLYKLKHHWNSQLRASSPRSRLAVGAPPLRDGPSCQAQKHRRSEIPPFFAFLSDILSCTNHACSQTHRSPISQGNKQLGSFAVGKNLTSSGTCRKRLTLLPNLSSLKMPAGYQHKISHRTYVSNIMRFHCETATKIPCGTLV